MDAGIATRFPLVSRAKPACRPLAARIAELGDAAARAEQTQDPAYQRVVAASEVYNKAALIASDCGLPDLARALCWQQWDAFATAAGESGQSAELLKLSLQPLLNFARQLIRDGEGDNAHQLLMQLFQAANDRQATHLHGRLVPLDMPDATDDERLAIRRHLWAALLADGSRALIAQHRWSEALDLARKFNGVGNRLLDGRQVLIIATLLSAGPDPALDLLDSTQTTTPWERAVAATIRQFAARQAGAPNDEAANLLVEHCRTALNTADSSTASFTARLAATATELLADFNPVFCTSLAAELSRFALEFADAYVAREVLSTATGPLTMTPTVRASMTALIEASHLGLGNIPGVERIALDCHVQRAAAVIYHVSASLTEADDGPGQHDAR